MLLDGAVKVNNIRHTEQTSATQVALLENWTCVVC